METSPSNRVERLLGEMSWPQRRLASYLRVSQAAVSGMVINGHETGPVSKLLDQLEADIAAGREPLPSPSAPEAAR